MSDDLNSLGIAKAPADTRVVVAMSGGVDSSVTAAVLKEQGYDVVGITLQLYDHGATVSRKGACCAGQDIHDARDVAAKLGIPHYVLDYEDRFRESVIDDFADAYVRGETPIPCVRCNQTVKFRDLFGTAKDLGADVLATGHYVRRADRPEGPALLRAVDPARDQSYFLFGTTAEQLDFLRFPLGALEKDETRAIAAGLGLAVADKPDSQDICFVPDGRYARIVEKLRPESIQPGEIVDLDGQVLGHHDGIINYTIGQRRGLGIGGRSDSTDPLYVVRLEPESRRVVVGPHHALGRDRLVLSEVNWLAGPTGEPMRAAAKIRSIMEPVPVTVHLDGKGGAVVDFDELQFGVSPGQACVVYGGGDGSDRVLGGGWIREALGRRSAAAGAPGSPRQTACSSPAPSDAGGPPAGDARANPFR